MHELALMTAVVERVVATARAEHARRVTGIRLVCGAMSGVVPASLQFCFDVCVADTIAAHARLHIEHVPAVWRCTQCGTTVAQDTCPTNAAHPLELERGREFFLASIDIDDPGNE